MQADHLPEDSRWMDRRTDGQTDRQTDRQTALVHDGWWDGEDTDRLRTRAVDSVLRLC